MWKWRQLMGGNFIKNVTKTIQQNVLMIDESYQSQTSPLTVTVYPTLWRVRRWISGWASVLYSCCREPSFERPSCRPRWSPLCIEHAPFVLVYVSYGAILSALSKACPPCFSGHLLGSDRALCWRVKSRNQLFSYVFSASQQCLSMTTRQQISNCLPVQISSVSVFDRHSTWCKILRLFNRHEYLNTKKVSKM